MKYTYFNILPLAIINHYRLITFLSGCTRNKIKNYWKIYLTAIMIVKSLTALDNKDIFIIYAYDTIFVRHNKYLTR